MLRSIKWKRRDYKKLFSFHIAIELKNYNPRDITTCATLTQLETMQISGLEICL